MKKVSLSIEQASFPFAKLSVEGKEVKVENGKMIVKECVISLDEIAENRVEVAMNLDHLRGLVAFLQRLLDMIDEEESIKLHVGGKDV